MTNPRRRVVYMDCDTDDEGDIIGMPSGVEPNPLTRNSSMTSTAMAPTSAQSVSKWFASSIKKLHTFSK